MNCFLPKSGFAPTTKAATVSFIDKLPHRLVVVAVASTSLLGLGRLRFRICQYFTQNNFTNNVFARILLNIHVMEDCIQISYLYDVFLRSTAKLPATSKQPEVTYTSCAKLTLLRYSSGLETRRHQSSV